MKRIISIAMTFVLIVGCATTSEVTLSPEREEYNKKIENFPLVFNISRAVEYDAWGRAQSFVGRYSSMKLQIATDFVIQTYNPNKTGQYGYYIVKTPMADSFQITVQCVGYSDIYDEEPANIYARMCAYYIKTGELFSEVLEETKRSSFDRQWLLTLLIIPVGLIVGILIHYQSSPK